jgi:hypothetical protein
VLGDDEVVGWLVCCGRRKRDEADVMINAEIAVSGGESASLIRITLLTDLLQVGCLIRRGSG